MKTSTILLNRKESIRAQTLIALFELSKPIYRFFFKQNQSAWQVTEEQLSQMPQNSLGKSLSIFLQNHQFDLVEKLESHDIAHVLLQYDTDVVSEICLQYVLIGSQKKSLYALGTCLIGLATFPEYATYFFAAYKRGQKIADFSQWDFEYLLLENIETLRNLIANESAQNKLYF